MKRVFLKLILCVLLSSFSSYSQTNDVRKGMNMEDALRVAKNCVLAASSYKYPRAKENPRAKDERLKELRPNYSLQFVGVVDEVRLDTLKRFIVRNSEFGVQSVWGFYKDKDFAKHYIISYAALEKIKSSSTITELATTIAANAGLPKLSFSKATQIVADCRNLIIKDNNETDNSAKKEKVAIKTDRLIADDFQIDNSSNSEEKRTYFTQCLEYKEEGKLKFGVQTAVVTDARNKKFNYFLKVAVKNEIENNLKQKGYKYSNLIEYLAEKADVPLSSEVSATYYVVNAILDAIPGSKDSISDINSFWLPGVVKDFKISGDTIVSTIPNISFGTFKNELIKSINSETILTGKTRNNKQTVSQLKQIQPNGLGEITPETTVEDTINIIEELINKQIN
jgi:hypothetical protein